ncbi:MAG TPA: hypothetical protein PKY59_08685 [Pyrinomonadaceae bacterium]|nr:hypothetical protein [Pyrinomonadaceae bacterium]
MFKQSRFFFSVSFIAVLFVSLFSFSNDVSAKSKRCPIEIPKPILPLYLQSDLVMIADIKNEKLSKPENDNTDDDSYLNVERTLDVVKVFKGQSKDEFVYSTTEYRPSIQENEPEEYFDGPYAMDKKLLQGKRYLLFFTKSDTDFYLTDYRSGVREITSANALVLDKRLDELSRIVALKKNQLPKITEWLVRLTEDDETRWDGTSSLSRSFAGIGVEETEEQAFVLDKTFNEYSPKIAEQVSQSQKDRLSNIFVASLNKYFYGNEKDAEFDYTLSQLVENWDRTRMAMYGFGVLQSIDKTDAEKTSRALNFISNIVSDTELYDIYYQYEQTVSENKEPEKIESVETEPVIEGDSNEPQNAVNEEGNEKNEEAVSDENSPENIRAEILQRFVNRYQVLLSRNFEPETETAQIVERDFSQIIQK